MGWQRVLSHLGVTITGSFSTRSRMISNEALPDPRMMPALSVVSGALAVASTSSTFLRDCRCLLSSPAFASPPR